MKSLLLEIVMEVFVEVFLEGLLWFTEALFPKRRLSDRVKRWLRLFCGILAALVFFALVVGIGLLVESGGTSVLGGVLVGMVALYVLLGVVLKALEGMRK